VSDDWDDYADGWDANEATISFADQTFKSLTSAITLDKPSVFDFGCGTGLLTERLAPLAKQIVALDISEKMVAVLDTKQLPNVSTLTLPLSLQALQETPELQLKFDLIVASSVCGFLPDYEGTLQLIKSMLSEYGTFVQWDWLATSENTEFGLTKTRVESALTNAGFSNINVTQPFTMDSPEGSMTVLMAIATT